jgi:DNA-binding NarL/FixJ family response regulator
MLDDPTRPGASAAARLRPPLAVVDLSLTPGEQGFALVRRLRARFPQLKLIVVGIHDDAHGRQSMLDAGASAFVPRGTVANDPERTSPTRDEKLRNSCSKDEIHCT